MAKPPPPITLNPPKAGGSTSKAPPAANTVLGLLVKDKRFRSYAQALGAIKRFASVNDVDPVELLTALGATGKQPTEQSLSQIGKSLSGYISLDAWAKGSGLPLLFDPFAVRNAITKRAGYVTQYVPTQPTTVTQDVKKGLKKDAVKTKLTDPYVKLLPNGKIATTQNAGEAIKSFDQFPGLKGFGVSLRVSDYQRASTRLNDYFTKYIGRQATPKEIFSLVSRGASEGAIVDWLTRQPGFKRGQIWQSSAPSIIGYAKNMMGEGYKVDPEFIRKAIKNNWNEGTLRRKLIEKPEYLNGPEFRQNTASLQNVYSQIMGRPDEAAVQGIKEAALGGWSSDQYAAYLRAQPQYAKGQEYKSKAMSFLEQLGMLTGQRATDFDVGMLGTPPPTPGADTNTPYSPRLSPTSPNAAAGYTPSAPVLTKNKAGTQQVAHPAPAKKPGKPGFRPF